MSRPRRRALLVGAAAGGAALAAGLGGPAWRRARGRARAHAHFTFPDGATALGRAYLAAFPAERAAPWREELAALTPANLRAAMAADLGAGRVVRIAGFTLSLTEARLYALCSI